MNLRWTVHVIISIKIFSKFHPLFVKQFLLTSSIISSVLATDSHMSKAPSHLHSSIACRTQEHTDRWTNEGKQEETVEVKKGK